jgi:hypothetical protein
MAKKIKARFYADGGSEILEVKVNHEDGTSYYGEIISRPSLSVFKKGCLVEVSKEEVCREK